MEKIPEKRLEPREPKVEVANFCSVCGEPIFVGDTYLNIPTYGWVCEYCANTREVAE